MNYENFNFSNAEIACLKTIEPYIERYEEKILKSGKHKLVIKIHKSNIEKCKVLSDIGFSFVIDSSGHKKYSKKFEKNNITYISTGRGGVSNAYGGANIDDLRECGVILWCESILQEKSPNEISEFMYSICGAKKITPSCIYDFLSKNPDWNESCEKSARTILNNIYKDGYIFHHKDDVFDSLKLQGKRLSKLASDKWNPADIFITSKKSIPNFKDLNTLNTEINKFDEILPVSLKKGSLNALGGSVALRHFYNGEHIKANEFSSEFIQQLKTSLRNISDSPLGKYVQVRKATDSNEFDSIVSGIQNTTISQSWFKSIPPIVAFLEDIAKNNTDLNQVIEKATLVCLSKAPESSHFYKVMGSEFEIFNSCSTDVVLEKCILSLNGDIDLKMEVSVRTNNECKKWKLQCRSKGSAPQFILVPSALGNPKNGEYDICISDIVY